MSQRFRAYNERKLKDWLYHMPDFHEQSYTATMDEVATISADSEAPVIGVWVRKTIDDDPPNTRASHIVLTEAVSHLQHRHNHLWMRLKTAYFNGLDSQPWLPDIWESEASAGSLPDKMAHKDYIEAIVHLMDYIEARIGNFNRTDEAGYGEPLEKLTVPVPSTVRYQRRSSFRKRRREALEKAQEYRQDMKDATAIRVAAAECGYTEKEIRVILRQYDEGRL